MSKVYWMSALVVVATVWTGCFPMVAVCPGIEGGSETAYHVVNKSRIDVEIEAATIFSPSTDAQLELNVAQPGERIRIYTHFHYSQEALYPSAAFAELRLVVPQPDGTFETIDLPLDGSQWVLTDDGLELEVTDEMLGVSDDVVSIPL